LIRSPKVWMVKPLAMTRRAESPGPAREHDEPFLGAVGTPDSSEPAAGIAAVEILLHHLPDDRPEKTALIRFAPEDCKACTPARNDLHTQPGTCRNDGKAPGKGRSSPDVGDDRLPPWREKSLKKRANITDWTASPRKNGMSPGSEKQSGRENVNRS